MSIQTEDHAPVPAPGPAPDPGSAPRMWAMTWHGVRTVTVLELRQRIRSTRWIVSLSVFAALVGLVTLLTWLALRSFDDAGYLGPSMFAFIVFFVLFLGTLVAPALSATAINGDRNAGTLATLQVTLLSAAEIAVGKLLAAWIASLAFLAVSTPFIIWAFASGGTSPVAVMTTLLVLAFVLAVVCAIGLGFSALTARTSASAVLTYVAVASLTFLSVVFFGLSIPLVDAEEEVRVYGVDWEEQNYDDPDYEDVCVEFTEMRYVAHTERTWWLLAANPFVVVADAAPAPQSADDEYLLGADPLSLIREGVRTARLGSPEVINECWIENESFARDPRGDDLPPVWPWGLAANLLLGVGALAVAVRRLQVPQRTLTRGTRVA